MLQREREKEKRRRKEEDEKLLVERKKEVREMVRKLNRGYKNLVDKKWKIVDKLMHVESMNSRSQSTFWLGQSSHSHTLVTTDLYGIVLYTRS